MLGCVGLECEVSADAVEGAGLVAAFCGSLGIEQLAQPSWALRHIEQFRVEPPCHKSRL